MKKILLLTTFLLIVVVALHFVQNNLSERGFLLTLKKTPTVTIANHVFKVTIASSQKEQEIGLSETKSISQDQGMIFLFKKPDYYPFWMKNMKFPIDIIYINQDEIVTIKSNIQPPKNITENPKIHTPTKPSDKVLEIQAGLCEKYKFKNGDKVKYENLGN